MTSRHWIHRAPCALLLTLLAACGAGGAGGGRSAPAPTAEKEPAADAEKSADETPESVGNAVTLTDDQVAHLGVRSTELKAVQHTLEVAGYGLVLPRDALAVAVSERSTAEAALIQSRAELARERELAGTAGALSTEAQQTAERQAAADEASAVLARSRLSALLGDHPAWGAGEATVLEQLEQGKIKLVRATFPLGVLADELPVQLRVGPLGGGTAAWHVTPVWRAPADANVPGRSLYALLRNDQASDGERLLVWAGGGKSKSGVVIPLSAVLMHDGRYWCYLERSATRFERVEFDVDAPTDQGYFVANHLHPGDRIVTEAAGLLLARQTGKADDAD
jgi:hypothetical protein